MFSARSAIPFMLVGGLIIIEVLSGQNSAQSQRHLSQAESDLILSILKGDQTVNDTPTTIDIPFPEFSLPASPFEVIQTTTRTPEISQPSDVLSDVLPPTASPLYYAYQDGGVYWYGKQDNLLVIFPDETIQSFNKKTGAATSWLQDKLALPPVSDPAAYSSYQSLYNAKIVAETSSWVLMEFPSGGHLKVNKPATQDAPTTSENLGADGLPDILPGYSN